MVVARSNRNQIVVVTTASESVCRREVSAADRRQVMRSPRYVTADERRHVGRLSQQRTLVHVTGTGSERRSRRSSRRRWYLAAAVDGDSRPDHEPVLPHQRRPRRPQRGRAVVVRRRRTTRMVVAVAGT